MQLTVPILKQTLNLASIICRVRINRRDITSDHLALLLMCLNSRAFLSFSGGLSIYIRRGLVSFDMLIYTIIGENCLLLILERAHRNFLIVLELVIIEETELLLIGICLSILRRTIL